MFAYMTNPDTHLQFFSLLINLTSFFIVEESILPQQTGCFLKRPPVFELTRAGCLVASFDTLDGLLQLLDRKRLLDHPVVIF